MGTHEMQIKADIQAFDEQLRSWRREIHRHPELGFEEHRTASLVAEQLANFGFEVTTGVGKTGVVGTLTQGNSRRAIGLRADMDALPMQELNTFEHRSGNDGVFHGCGHDGHTTMLLGAARYLGETKNFDGTVHVIFQPAEEGLGGAMAMIEDGLFDRFPMENVYGMHNWPGLPVGEFAIRPGPMMAASTVFDITLKGVGGHGAMPHFCADPVVVAAELIGALQSVVSRNVDPIKTAVISVTKLQAGNAYNVIPDEVTISGGMRYFETEVGELVMRRCRELAEHIASAHLCSASISFEEVFAVLNNAASATENAVAAATDLVGPDRVTGDYAPIMGSEDFAFMLQAKPGAYIFVGNGDGEGGCMVHHPEYDFNDNALVYGASYWSRLVEQLLPASP